MPIEIERASFDAQKTDLIELLRRHLTPDSNEKRFDWLYCRNPNGPAQAWLAWDTTKKSIVGLAAAFPRRFYFRGKEKWGLVLGDFCLAEEYRSMGPALQLQRACLKALVPPYDFCYDFPSKSMMAIYRRMGIPQAGSLVRWAKPLRIDERFEAVVRSKRAAKTIGPVLNKFLAARGWKGEQGSCDIELAPGPYGEQFTALDELLSTEQGIRSDRGAAYLNWRYFEAPHRDYEILAARRNATLLGYVALKNNQEDARIIELVSLEQPGVIVRLIALAVERLRAGGAKSVSLVAGENHRWSRLFERAGFRRRETSPVVFAVREERQAGDAAFYSGSHFMEGERDS
jgi:hypothetical protein